jgi:uncharacterized repeat protein (TIGR03943 family)
MRPPDDYLKEWLHPIVFGLWIFALVYLLIGQRYTAFLRAEFGLLLVIALLVAVGFMVATMAVSRNRNINFSGVARAGVLLLPILYLMSMSNTTLGVYSFKNRFIGPGSLSMGRKGKPDLKVQTTEESPGPLQKEEGEAPAPQEWPQECTILELLNDPTRYQGRRVSVTGMILRDEKLKRHLGEIDTIVYRFLINCCAADALPLAVAVEPEQAVAIDNGQWVQVEGTLQFVEIKSQSEPVLKKATITPTKPPGNPFLF